MAAPGCQVCGALIDPSRPGCPYDVPLDRAPGIGDPAALSAGKQSHADHELHIARWRIHHPTESGATPAVMAWARDRLARAGHQVADS